MPENLHDLEDRVFDEETFLEFLHALTIDREDCVAKEAQSPSSPYGPQANGWENSTIEAFLGAATAWGDCSINGLPLMPKETNPWRRCAQILHMGKIYE